MSTIPPIRGSSPGAPTGPIEKSWDQHKFDMKLVNPDNKRKFEVIVVGTGLAGASAAASMAQLGYKVKVFTFHDSPRRAHSIAAQGGINAAKNYPNDGDSDLPPLLRHREGRRLPRPRGQRLPPRPGVASTSSTSASPRACPSPASTAACSTTAPSAARRCRRTFYARGQTGQQLLLGAYQALDAAGVARATSKLHTKTEMLDVVVEGRQGLRHRHPRPRHRRDQLALRPRRGAVPPAATATSSTCRPTP